MRIALKMNLVVTVSGMALAYLKIKLRHGEKKSYRNNEKYEKTSGKQ